MLDRIREAWDEAARDNAQASILTVGELEEHAFYETGRVEIARVLNRLQVCGLNIAPITALDFGCGIGRLTVALAEHFVAVDGVDISREMIRRARPASGAVYHCSSSLDLFPDKRFDLVYSNITLQHMPSELQQDYIRQFMRVVEPDGAVVFEIPECQRPTDYTSCQTMFGATSAEVAEWVTKAGGCVVDIQGTESSGQGVQGWRYIAIKLKP